MVYLPRCELVDQVGSVPAPYLGVFTKNFNNRGLEQSAGFELLSYGWFIFQLDKSVADVALGELALGKPALMAFWDGIEVNGSHSVYLVSEL